MAVRRTSGTTMASPSSKPFSKPTPSSKLRQSNYFKNSVSSYFCDICMWFLLSWKVMRHKKCHWDMQVNVYIRHTIKNKLSTSKYNAKKVCKLLFKNPIPTIFLKNIQFSMHFIMNSWRKHYMYIYFFIPTMYKVYLVYLIFQILFCLIKYMTVMYMYVGKNMLKETSVMSTKERRLWS